MRKSAPPFHQDPAGILAALDRFLGEGAPRRVIVAAAVPGGGAGADWRLVLIGRGRWRLRFPADEEVRAEELTRRDALLLPPGAWFHQDGGTTRTKLYLQLSRTHTYGHYSWHRPDASAHRLVWDNVMTPVGPAAWHTLQALAEVASGAESAVVLLRALLLEVRAHLTVRRDSGGEGRGARMFASICRYLESNHHLPLTRETVAREFRVHPNHVSRLFRSEGGEGFHRHLERLRMERAGQLARRRVFTADELAAACGYGSTANFRKTFRRYHGVPPGRYG